MANNNVAEAERLRGKLVSKQEEVERHYASVDDRWMKNRSELDELDYELKLFKLKYEKTILKHKSESEAAKTKREILNQEYKNILSDLNTVFSRAGLPPIATK